MTFPKAIYNATELRKAMVISPPPGTRASSTSDIPQQNDQGTQQQSQQLVEAQQTTASLKKATDDTCSIKIAYPITSEKPLECTLCFFYAIGKTKHRIFREHLGSSHNRGVISWSCPVCSEYSNSEAGSVATHLRKCKSKHCNKYRSILEKDSGSASSSLRRTEVEISYNGNVLPAKCGVCGLSVAGLGQWSEIEDHIRNAHGVKSLTFVCASCNSEKLASIVSARAHYTHCSRRLTKVKDGVSNVDNALGCGNRDNLGSAERNHEPIRSRQNSALQNSFMADCDVATECVDVPILSPTSSCVDVQFGSPTSPCVNVQIGSPTSSFRSTSSTKSSTSSNHTNVMIESGDPIPMVAQSISAPHLTVFTVAEAYDFFLSCLNSPRLHQRYSLFLKSMASLLRDQRLDFDQALLDEVYRIYSNYLCCGNGKIQSSFTSASKSLGLKIIKIKKSSRMSLSAVAFHVHCNPAQGHIVHRKVLASILDDSCYYESVMKYITDTSLSLDVLTNHLKRGDIVSDLLVLWAAANVYNCDFVVYKPDGQHIRIRSRRTSTQCFPLWLEDSNLLPCVRSRALNRAQKRLLNRRRSRALYFANTTQLANEIFRDVSLNDCKMSATEIDSHFRNLFELPRDEPSAKDTCESSETSEFVQSPWSVVTADEIFSAMSGIKPCSSVGVDRINIRQIKAYDRLMVGPILIFNIALQVGSPPTAWAENKTVLIPKNGADAQKLNSISGWRPITISSVLMRIFHRAILSRMRKSVELEDSPDKCRSYSQCYIHGKLIINHTPFLSVESKMILPILDGEPVKYLGGKPWYSTKKEDVICQINDVFSRTKKAQISPIQSAHLLNDYALPKIIEALESSHDVSTTAIAAIDNYWRTQVKRLLFLPAFLNNGAFNLPLNQGGLGFRSILHEVLTSRQRALKEMMKRYPGLERYVPSAELSADDSTKREFHERLKLDWRAATTQALGATHFF
ncbi:hypothetical protein ACOME3_004666 [Neoechinorhynchus agilis]